MNVLDRYSMAMTAPVVKDEPRTTTVTTIATEGHPFAQLQTLTSSNVVALRSLNLSQGFDINSPDDVTVSKNPLRSVLYEKCIDMLYKYFCLYVWCHVCIYSILVIASIKSVPTGRLMVIMFSKLPYYSMLRALKASCSLKILFFILSIRF